jgi:hypothetical protein
VISKIKVVVSINTSIFNNDKRIVKKLKKLQKSFSLYGILVKLIFVINVIYIKIIQQTPH